MLNQENQVKATEPSVSSVNGGNSTQSSTENNNMSNSKCTTPTNPLSEHDYCSPVKSPMESSSNNIQPSEGREKRQRKEVHDPEFSHFSDYSSSEPESDDQAYSECDEDDPNRLWCICNQPYDGKFMIECDGCYYWFHGECINVTEKHSDRMKKKQWLCDQCQEAADNGTPLSAIPRRIPRKLADTSKSTGKRRGRPRKSAVQAREPSARQSLRSARRLNSSLDSRMSSRKNSTKSTGSESFNEFEHPDRLKELIRERRKAFFLKHRLSEQLKVEKMNQVGAGRRSLTASLSDSMDSLVASTNSPNMHNLPINIKSEHNKEKSKPNIVLQINTKKDSSSESGSQRMVTAIVKKRKRSETTDSSASEVFTAEPLQVGKKTKKEKEKAKNEDRSSPTTPKQAGKSSPTSESKANSPTKSLQKMVAIEQSASRRKRKDSDSTSTNGPQNMLGPRQMIKMIHETLELRSAKLNIHVATEKIEQLAEEIQGQLADCYKEGSPKCINKFRSLIFNLRDPKNEMLMINVLNGEIIPSRLVRMSHDDLASNELSNWRERENKHSIELIKRDAQFAAEEVIVKKTHKGEEVISAFQNDADNPASSSSNSQDLPTTPTKTSTRPELSKTKSPQPTSVGETTKLESANTLAGLKLEPPKTNNGHQNLVESATNNQSDPLALLDTTKDHKNHVFDIGCKICTKQQTEGDDVLSGQEIDSGTTIKKESEPEKAQDQPKRLRITIDTKLDLANLSRLREPLLKPAEKALEEVESSPARASPNADLSAWQGDEDEKVNQGEDSEDADDIYDPETSTMTSSKKSELESPSVLNSRSWSGTITMQDVGRFDAFAKSISGSADFIRNKIGQTLTICGRISQDQVTLYIKKIKSTTRNQIILVQLHPLTDNDKVSFDKFFDYLYARNRWAVVNCSASSQILKDFYIIPIHESRSIPDILKPINGPGLDRTTPNCLLGLLVKTKRPPSVSSSTSSSYTPASINQ